MIFHPAVIALLAASILISTMALYSSIFGLQILFNWDIESGSERQLILERRTYLISTFLTYLFGFQLISLFLFVFTADRLHSLFTGAMCAAGSLHLNRFGYPALILKIINFIFSGLWLIWNYTDNKAYDYPLIKKKYLFLVLLTPFLIAETILQGAYFLGLHPDVITSCCASLFNVNARGLGATLAALPPLTAKIALFLTFGLTLATGAYRLISGRGTYWFALFCIVFFLAALASVISFVSVYIYELPSHHCPFCLLHGEYNYIGYPLYITLFGGAIFGLGAGILEPFRQIRSLSALLPSLQNKLISSALIFYSISMIIMVYKLYSSGLRLDT